MVNYQVTNGGRDRKEFERHVPLDTSNLSNLSTPIVGTCRTKGDYQEQLAPHQLEMPPASVCASATSQLSRMWDLEDQLSAAQQEMEENLLCATDCWTSRKSNPAECQLKYFHSACGT